MIVRCIVSRTKPAIHHSVNSLSSKSSHLSATISTADFNTKLKNIFSNKLRSSSATGTQNRVPFFDPSIKINPDLLKTHSCERAIGYQFREPLLLWEALLAYEASPHLPRYSEGNKRLAILGDRILDLLLALKWYPTWTPRRT